jgi:hypothetical protein
MSNTRGPMTRHQVKEHGLVSSKKENDDSDKLKVKRVWNSKSLQVKKDDYQSCRLCDFSDTFRRFSQRKPL